MRINTLPDEVIPPFDVAEQDFWSRRTLLTGRAQDFMRPSLVRLGFAAAPIKRQKSNISIRIVWLYPEVRSEPPFIYYEPAITVSIPHDQKNKDWEIRPTTTSIYNDTFWQFFEGEAFDRLSDIFSEAGLARIKLEQDVIAGGIHPRTLKRKKIREFIASQERHWDDPEHLVQALRDIRLYSNKVPNSQQLWGVESIVRSLREQQNKKS